MGHLIGDGDRTVGSFVTCDDHFIGNVLAINVGLLLFDAQIALDLIFLFNDDT